MADTKISALAALTGAGTASNDLIPLVDVSASATKNQTFAQLWVALSTLNVKNAYTQTYSTVDRTLANNTSATLTDNGGGGVADGTISAITADNTVKDAVKELSTQVNALIVDLLDVKQFVNGLVDDLQSLGLIT